MGTGLKMIKDENVQRQTLKDLQKSTIKDLFKESLALESKYTVIWGVPNNWLSYMFVN